MSRSELARELGVTRTTVGYAIKELLEAELVCEPTISASPPVASEANRIGRPSVGVSLNATGAYFVGLDISTTSLTAVLIDLTMTVVAKFTTSVGPDLHDVSGVTNRLATLAKRAIRTAGERRDRVRGIGVSVPGLVRRDGRVAVAPFLEWRDVDLRTRLIERLGNDFNIRVCNDAVALASAVCSAASAIETSDLLLVLISEGIGSAIIRQGAILEGFNGYAGEIGQMVMASTIAPQFPQTFQLLAGQRFFAPFLPEGRLAVDAIVELAALQPEPSGLHKALEQWAAHLAAGFLNAIWMLDPERIVVGGVLAPLYPRVAARVDTILSESMAGLRTPPILVSKYGAEGAAVGAAAMIREAIFAMPEFNESVND
jgi:predicted NBD/HSP70 family sugar kinase